MSEFDGRSGHSGPATGGEYVYRALSEAGIDLIVGLPGTQTLPIDRVVARREDMRYVVARHETAIPHVAWGYYEACGTPAATLTVPGPGDTNAMHGLKNAYEDSIPIVHVSADVDPADRGKGPIHEIEPDTYDNVVKENVTVDRPRDLRAAVERGIELAMTQPYGPVRLGIPSGFLEAEINSPATTYEPARTSYDNDPAYAEAVDLLRRADRPLLYAGGGVRRSPSGTEAIRGLADLLNAPVAVSLKGKGTVPEDEPRFLGVTGSGCPADVRAVLEDADVVLAVGTDFDGVATDGWSLPMGDALIHVTVDAADVGHSYDPDVAIFDDAGTACDELATTLRNCGVARGWDGERLAQTARASYESRLEEQGLLEASAPASTPALLHALREVLPREAIVTTDIGGFRLWTTQVFETYDPEAFVTGGSWAGMGIGLPAALGTKLARPERPVLALVGDGGLMMNLQECHTAAEYDLDVTVVVSNNSDYGVISKSPKIRSYGDGRRFAWDSPSFATIAEGFGWECYEAAGVDEGCRHVEAAVDNGEPTLVDVTVDPDEPTAAAVAEYDPSDELF